LGYEALAEEVLAGSVRATMMSLKRFANENRPLHCPDADASSGRFPGEKNQKVNENDRQAPQDTDRLITRPGVTRRAAARSKHVKIRPAARLDGDSAEVDFSYCSASVYRPVRNSGLSPKVAVDAATRLRWHFLDALFGESDPGRRWISPRAPIHVV
jgi:hypothetical protein